MNTAAQTIPDGYKLTEGGIFPRDWSVVKIEDLATYRRGSFPQPYGLDKWYDEVSGMPFIQVFDVDDNLSLKKTTKQKISKSAMPYSVFVKKGSLILTIQGSIGRVAITDNDAYMDRTLLLFESFKLPVDKNYLKYALFTLFEKEKLKAPGGIIKTITKEALSDFFIALPNESEQTAIAQILIDIDSLIQKTEKLIAKKKAIKQGTMQELLTGKRRLPGYDEEWKISSLENLCRTFTKQTGFDYSETIKKTLITSYKSGYIPFIQNKDFEGHKINYHTDYFIPESIAIRFPRILLNEKCLLISISGSIGNVAVYSNLETAFVGGAVAVGKFVNTELLSWVMYYLQSSEGQTKLFGSVKAGSHHNLTLEDIRKIDIPIPPLDEQKQITTFLMDIDGEISAHEKKLSKIRQIKQGAMQMLLTGKIRLINN